MSQSHYSLRWNNHQSHILSAFDALLQAETLVDVTLVCAETSVRAHKVVLSACSPFFQRIFSENPCKHPVIVLKDFHGWEVQAIVDFMYKGEISVGQEQLQNLIKAAESLQVRGLAHQDPLNSDKECSPITNRTPTPSTSPTEYERPFCPSGRFPTPGTTVRAVGERSSPFSPLPGPNYEAPLKLPAPSYEPPLKLPHMTHPSFGDNLLPRHDCASPLPRRKQARPRRRSGELCGAQDLTKPSSPQQPEETAENLCMKKPAKEPAQKPTQHIHHHSAPLPAPHHLQPPPISQLHQQHHQEEQRRQQQQQQQQHQQQQQQQQQHQQQQHQQQQQHHQQQQLKTETPDPASPPELDLSMPDKEYAPSPPLSLPPVLGMLPEHHMDSHSPLPFPPMPSVSALAMTPPHIFGLDSPLGLFPPGLDGCRNPLLDMADPRTTPDTQMFVKKKSKCNVQVGRPKGQHSAPRGGPPRSWTNAELTEALQHVWNKKMTTSQASRIFGIPYNSLLMYVRGKYGKSLKLEQLRKDCIGGPGGPLDLLNLGSGNNNNNQSKESNRDRDQDAITANTRPPSNEDLPPPVFNPFAPNFYPDFGSGFPIPVSMIHLLPQSEKNRESCGPPPGMEEDCKDRMKEMEEEHPELFRPPALSRDERRELLQQNGQD